MQSELPLTNFVYPARRDVELAEVFDDVRRTPVDDPLAAAADDIAAHRDEWVETWTRTVLR